MNYRSAKQAAADGYRTASDWKNLGRIGFTRRRSGWQNPWYVPFISHLLTGPNAPYSKEQPPLLMIKMWRPLTQDELPYLSGGDTLTLRLNYLYNPDRLPVTYRLAVCVEKRKRDGTFIVEGTDTPIDISLTEAGRYVGTGWYMTGEELHQLKFRDPIRVHDDAGGFRPARYMGGASPYTSKVLFDGETEPISVLVRLIGPAHRIEPILHAAWKRIEGDELAEFLRLTSENKNQAPKSGLQAQGLLASFDEATG